MDTNVPYVVHEGAMTRLERANKRLWILCVVMFLAFALSNGYWVWYESQFEDVVSTEEVTQDVDTGNGNATVTGIGDIYGTSETDG